MRVVLISEVVEVWLEGKHAFNKLEVTKVILRQPFIEPNFEQSLRKDNPFHILKV